MDSKRGKDNYQASSGSFSKWVQQPEQAQARGRGLELWVTGTQALVPLAFLSMLAVGTGTSITSNGLTGAPWCQPPILHVTMTSLLLGARSFWVSHIGGKGPQTWASSGYFPGIVAGGWIRSSAKTPTDAHMGGQLFHSASPRYFLSIRNIKLWQSMHLFSKIFL